MELCYLARSFEGVCHEILLHVASDREDWAVQTEVEQIL